MPKEFVKETPDKELNRLSALAQVLTLLIYIQEVSGSNLRLGTGYLEGKGFLSFPQALQVNSGLVH